KQLGCRAGDSGPGGDGVYWRPAVARRGIPMAVDQCGPRVSRRRFARGAGLAGLALVVGCGRLPWQAQQPPRVPRIGYLYPNSSSSQNLELFRQRLRELGYVEDQAVIIEARWAEGSTERLPPLAAELVALPVDVIVAVSPGDR